VAICFLASSTLLLRRFLNLGLKVAGIEARGFILGAAVAARMGVGFVAIRKQSGLYPGPKLEKKAPADYRGNRTTLRLQRAAITPGDRILLVDDWFGKHLLIRTHLLGH